MHKKMLHGLLKTREANMAAMAIGVAVVLIVGIIAAVVYFNVSDEVPQTDNNTNETIDSFNTYAKLAFGFIGLGAFVGAAFMIIGIMRGGGGAI